MGASCPTPKFEMVIPALRSRCHAAAVIGTLYVNTDGPNIVLTDGKGMKLTVTGFDVIATNGVVHTIDIVVMN